MYHNDPDKMLESTRAERDFHLTRAAEFWAHSCTRTEIEAMLQQPDSTNPATGVRRSDALKRALKLIDDLAAQGINAQEYYSKWYGPYVRK